MTLPSSLPSQSLLTRDDLMVMALITLTLMLTIITRAVIYAFDSILFKSRELLTTQPARLLEHGHVSFGLIEKLP